MTSDQAQLSASRPTVPYQKRIRYADEHNVENKLHRYKYSQHSIRVTDEHNV